MSARKLTPAAEVAQLRARIEELRNDLATVEVAPLPLEEASEQLKRWIDAQARRFAQDLPMMLRSLAEHPPRPTMARLVLDVTGRPSPSSETVFATADVGPLLCWLDGERLLERANEAFQSLQPYAGLPAAERPAARERLQAQLLRCEVQEEQIIRAAEASGEPIQRRGDCRVELVVTTDAALATIA